ncbi:MAG TPA: DegV family protein [Bacillota bacterium]
MIKITADSTCDLSPEILKAMDITLVPLYILVGNKTFRDGVDITPPDIFHYVEREGKVCRTAAVNIFDYESFFRELSPQYEGIIHICIGAEFSSCYQNASLAAQNFSNVYVIDSRNLSTGSGHLVYEAALMAREGMGAEEICSRLAALIPRIDASFVIERVDYLHKGGRCSGLEAFGARLIQIKPSIEVINGQMTVGKKYRGSFERCLEQYVKNKLEAQEDIDYSRVFITHTTSEQIVERVQEVVRSYANFAEVIPTKAGCTVSSHCGPNTLGILFKRKNEKK